jgi:hypothetical protein
MVNFQEHGFFSILLTPRWSQRRLPLEFIDGLTYTTIIEFAEPLARRRGWYVLQSYSAGGEASLDSLAAADGE